MNIRNPFLDQVCTKLKEQRPIGPWNYAHRIESIAAAPFMSLWFRTRGCKHDLQGGCTMCNYGISSPASTEEMVEYVREGLSLLNVGETTMLLVSPSGSMFDEWEVPAEARRSIFQLARESKCRRYTCETRAETLTDRKVKEFAQIFNNKIAVIEMGLESANPWILKYCVNKALSREVFQRATRLLQKYNIPGVANVMLGNAFLSPREAIEDAVETVKWAIDQGIETAVVFPSHVKKWTLLEWLWERGLYSPPSLWSLVEVLVRLGPELTPRATISWYKIYDQISNAGMIQNPQSSLGFLDSPTTCALCRPKVIELLDAFRNTNNFGFVKDLAAYECDCKKSWQAILDTQDPLYLQKRVSKTYELMGRDILGEEWWVENGERIMQDLDLTI